MRLSGHYWLRYRPTDEVNVRYPSATSSNIITAKPSIVPIVARSALQPEWDSGITTSTTTKIIAPAGRNHHTRCET